MTDRRTWLATVGAVLLPMPACVLRTRTDPALSAAEFGAIGDGVSDDTAALQQAIDVGARERRPVEVPPGRFRVDAVRGLRLRDRSDLRLHVDTVLLATPNGEGYSAVLRGNGLTGVRVSGGTIIGERDGHTGTTGEWGMGIDLRGCTNAVLEGITARDCWGDGFYVGHSIPARRPGGECRGVTVRRCRGLRNRRQGISVVGCLGGTIEESEFSGTFGTLPEDGVVLEPNPGKVVTGVIVRACTLTDNHGWGGVMWGAAVTDCGFIGNVVHGNPKGGLYVWRGSRNEVRGNQIVVQGGPAIGADSLARGTTVRGNICRRAEGRPESASPLVDVDPRFNRVDPHACRPPS